MVFALEAKYKEELLKVLNDLEDFKSKVSYTATLEDDEEYYFTNESVLKEIETEDSNEVITQLETNSL